MVCPAAAQILERYLNTCYWGHGVFGIAGAAAAYFRKKPAELNVSEAALLAGLLPCPEVFSPFNDPKTAQKRRTLVRPPPRRRTCLPLPLHWAIGACIEITFPLAGALLNSAGGGHD
jgi:hypothetical protein